MPGTPTPIFGWPIPALTDPPDGPTQMDALAKAIETTVQYAVNAPNCQVYQTAAQSIPSGSTSTALIFDTEDIDTANMWSAAAATRLICKVAGTYLLLGAVAFAANATGRRGGLWAKNGTNLTLAAATLPATAASTWSGPMPTSEVKLVVNDYIELRPFQDSGVALNTGADTTVRSFAAMCRVGP
jgi:hypothetical protein